MSGESEASKGTQTAHVPLITGEISPMQELRMGFGPVQVSWDYLHELKRKILDLESHIRFTETQQDRAKYFIDKYVAESTSYREKHKEALCELEKEKCARAEAESHICLMTKNLQEMQIELSEMGIALIEERNSHSESRKYANTLSQENDRLKRRLEQLETAQSETRTQLGAYMEEVRAPMTPVSVPSSPREQRQHGNPNTPRLLPETPETASDVDDVDDGEEVSMSSTLFNYMEEMRLQEMEMKCGRRESESSATTDCSGDPLYHSDSD
jgi:hypothetical protein